MTRRIALSSVAVNNRAVLDSMAHRYFRELRPDGPAYYPAELDVYWTERGRHAWLIELNGTPVGFALARALPEGAHELAEFCIVAAERRRGFGTLAACAIFHALGGVWSLGVARGAPGLMDFWRRTLADCEGARNIAQGPPFNARQMGSFSFRIKR